MKFLHLSDLHLGKRLRELSLLEDQKYILDQIVGIADDEQPDGVLIAGDVYDKSMPSAESVALFDGFLTELSSRGISVFVISGNHDSPERIAYGHRILNRGGVYVSPVYDGNVPPITMHDEYGPVDLYLLPFVKPAHVKACFPDEEIESYTDAVRTAVAHMGVDESRRSILLTHQFVTGADRTESETFSVGGTDNVDVSVFAPFDYTALGHIHRPQFCGSERIRYCGTPLKYSFSEVNDEKSVTVAELKEKGDLRIRCVKLKPLHDMREIRGTYDGITLRSFYENTGLTTDYVRITLTDEEETPGVGDKLRVIYTNWMAIVYDNHRTRENRELSGAEEIRRKSPLELFEELYERQNNLPMSGEQRAFMTELMNSIWEGGS